MGFLLINIVIYLAIGFFIAGFMDDYTVGGEAVFLVVFWPIFIIGYVFFICVGWVYDVGKMFRNKIKGE